MPLKIERILILFVTASQIQLKYLGTCIYKKQSKNSFEKKLWKYLQRKVHKILATKYSTE